MTSLDPSHLRVLDPGLFFEGGHHASFARTIADAARAREIACEVFGLRRIDHPPAALEIGRCFRRSAYEVLRSDDPYDELLSINRDMLEDLRSLGGSDHPGVVTLFPTITSRLVLAAARWASQDASGPVSMLLMFPPGFAGDERLALAERRLYREAMRLVSDAPAGRIRLFAETARIAGVFKELGAELIEPLAWPVTVPTNRVASGPREDGARVAHLGYTKAERGFALLPESIRGVLAASPSTRFRIQANYWDPSGVGDADAALSRMPSVEMIRGPMAPAVYADELASADIVLLPYRADAYRHRGSGVFVEAAALGRVLVIPDETWMADQAREHGLGVVVFDRFDAESVGNAVLRAIDGRDALLARAQRAATGWVDSRAPERFLDAVLARRLAERSESGEAA